METTNANDAYRAARDRLDEQLKVLDRLLRKHGAKQFRDQRNWGYRGDLGYVSEVLDEVIAFFGSDGSEKAGRS